MLAKRLLTIFLISKEAPTHSIADLLQVSPSTVARYQAEVQAGKWNATTTWLQRRRVEDTFLSVITDVLLLPVVDGGKPLSLGRFLDEKL
jgi:predicted transcriptional regulator